MTTNSETMTPSMQFAQIFRSVKRLTVREQLTLAKLVLESVLSAKPDAQDEWPAGFFELTAGAWAGGSLVREPQVDYEERHNLDPHNTHEFDRVPGLQVEGWALPGADFHSA